MKILEGLWQLVGRPGCRDYSDTIIFMPSNRSISAFQKMIIDKTGGAAALPKFVPLGTGEDDGDEPAPKTGRVIAVAEKIKDRFGYDMSGAIQVAATIVQAADYIDTEEAPWPDWAALIPESFSKQFSDKAEMLEMAKPDGMTDARKRTLDIRGWIPALGRGEFKRVFACGSTGSIPATRALLTHIAKMPEGAVILPGNIIKMPAVLPENHPYWAQAKLLENIGIMPGAVQLLDTGKSNVDFLNSAFSPGNIPAIHTQPNLIECERESQEMDIVATLIQRAQTDGKSVLVASPDVSASYRLLNNLERIGIVADLSIGQGASMMPLAKLLLSIIEVWTNPSDRIINTTGILGHKMAREYPGLSAFIKDNFRDRPGDARDFYKLDPALAGFLETPSRDFSDRLIAAAEYITDAHPAIFSEENRIVWETLADTSAENITDWKAIFQYKLSVESVRPNVRTDAKVSVLGTIEARMIPSDVVIICGLNEGMFPKKGFVFPWFGKAFASAAGLPGAERKAGLMALDFINLSCAPEVYWTRSRVIGRAPSIQSRFLSRMEVADKTGSIVRENYKPRIPEFVPLLQTAPRPPAITDPIYATQLDTLFHNPFEFYAKHILNLRPMDNIRTEPDARDYGILVHKVIENSSAENLAQDFIKGARLMTKNPGTLYFWQKRFDESLAVIRETLDMTRGAKSEVPGGAVIGGRVIKARADRVWDGGVLDIKTGGAPSAKSLAGGNAPQVPVSAYILETGGFEGFGKSQAENMAFLDLKKNRLYVYQDPAIIIKTIEKCREIFKKLGIDGAEYRFVQTGDAKYHTTDHLYRI
jgi:ATP-dependent helicase/nuclease subunit B